MCVFVCVCEKTGESVTRPMCSGSSQGRTYMGINQQLQHDKSHCCRPLSYGRTLCRQRAAGVCNRDEGSMVKLAENLMRPRGSAIVTRVPWFDGRQIQKFRDFRVGTARGYYARGALLPARKRYFIKKNLNAPRPSEHPPVRGKKCQNV